MKQIPYLGISHKDVIRKGREANFSPNKMDELYALISRKGHHHNFLDLLREIFD
jgi:hypothetical protein